MALYFVFAGAFYLLPISPSFIVEDAALNVTVTITNGEGTVNITHLNITFPGDLNFSELTNTTNATGAFSNVSNGSSMILIWTNTTGGNNTLIQAGRSNTFSVNITSRYPQNYTIVIDTRDTAGTLNQTTGTLVVIDNTNPSAAGTFPANTTTYNTTSVINFTCNVTDDGGIQNVTLYLQSQPKFMFEFPGPPIINVSIKAGEKANQTNFTQTITTPGTYSWKCIAYDNSTRRTESGNLSATVNAFSISGWIKNSTFSNVSGANVSIYRFIFGQMGPPTEQIVKETTSNASGGYVLSDITSNGSEGFDITNYKIKVTLNNSAGLVTEIGPSTPPMPSKPLVFSLSGGTLYLQNATTIELYAYNSSNISALFGYVLMDQSLGYPIDSAFNANISNVNFTVASGRNYTVLFVREFSRFPMNPNSSNFTMDAACMPIGNFPSNYCPTPLLSTVITSNNIQLLQNSTEINSTNYRVTVNKSLSFTFVNLTGCLNFTGGNLTYLNISDVSVKMVPWEGFIPPMKGGEVSDFNPADASHFTPGSASKGCNIGRFNLSLLSSGSGISYFLEVYATNGSNLTAATQGQFYAAFQNITMTGERVLNLTLTRTLGTYSAADNTSVISVSIADDNGTAPQDAHVEVFVRHPVFGSVHYIVESLTNGKFNFTFLNNTLEAKVRVFSSQYAPKEKKINLNTNSTTINISSFKSEKIHANGSKEKLSGSSLGMKFMRYSAACNVFTPPSSCKIGDEQNGNFDPMKAMLAGKVNLYINTSSGVKLYFINVDMFASGPPDILSNDNASSSSSSGTSLSEIWKFGSLAPDVYDEVFIGIPFNSSVNLSNSTWHYNLSIPLIYDENLNVTWNVSENTTGQLPSEYSDYNQTLFTGTGFICVNQTINKTAECFLNTTSNEMWIRIPHFSTNGVGIGGASPTVASDSGSSSGGGGGGGSAVTATTYEAGTLSATVTNDMKSSDKLRFSVDDEQHTLSLAGISSSQVIVTVNSTPITKTIQEGQSAAFDFENDGKDDVSVSYDNYSVSGGYAYATITVTPLQVTAPASSVQDAEETTTPSQPQTTSEQPQQEASQTIKKSLSSGLWASGIVILFVIIVVAVLLQRQSPGRFAPEKKHLEGNKQDRS